VASRKVGDCPRPLSCCFPRENRIRLENREGISIRSVNRRAAYTSQSRRHFADSERLESERLGFVCECPDPDCRRRVSLTLEEYEARRPDPIIHRDHSPLPLRLVGS